MPVVPLSGAIRASDIRGAVNDIDTDGPGNLNYTQISIDTARDKLHTPQGRTNAPSSGQVAFSQFRKSQAISVTITVKGETPRPGYDDNNDGSIKVVITPSKVTGDMTTTVSGQGSKSGVSPSTWTLLNSANYTVTVNDDDTGFSTSRTVNVPLSTATNYYYINIA